MRVISASEIYVLAQELRELAGFHMEKFYEMGEGRFRIKMKRDKTQANLQIILSHTINKTNYIERTGQPSNFAMAVRKRIEGFRIESIKQINGDRIVLMALKKGEAELNLVIEMFGSGNLVITDSSMRITLAYRQRQFSDRRVSHDMEYRAPRQPSGYKMEAPKVVKPVVFVDEKGRAVDYSIAATEKHPGLERRGFGSLQEALDLFYYDNPVVKGESGESALEKQLRLSIEKQKRLMKSTESEIETNKEIAEKIFNNMNMINRIVEELKKSKRMTKEELQEHAEGIRITDLDLKEKRVTIEID